MIRFSCRCGYLFEAPDDAAGMGLQCPQCRLLNDVPYLSDVSRIAGDGTYNIDDQPRQNAPSLQDMAGFYGSAAIDGRAESVDLRNSPDEMNDVGEIELAEDAARRNRPRYDPETGELVKPIPFGAGHEQLPRIDPSSIPFATATINYAVNDTLRPKSVSSVLLDLLSPINVVVMAFVLGLHLFIAFLMFGVAMNYLFVVPIPLGVMVAIIAHYGNVIDEIGPGERDELPRPMRDMQLSEDLLHPFFSVFWTAIICYGPALFFASHSSLSSPATAAIVAALAIGGTFFIPAILITLLTSGSVSNLRPDRILGVIRESGMRYYGLVLAYLAALVPYAWAMAAFTIEAYRTMRALPPPIPKWATMWPVSLPIMCLGIFGMHFFCWELGILYRLRSPAFPWIGRVHVQAPRPPVQRRKPKYIIPPGDA